MKLTKELRNRKKLIEREGVRVIDVVKKGKHPKFVITNGKKTIKMTVAMTASDKRGDKNMVAFVRRNFAEAA